MKPSRSYCRKTPPRVTAVGPSFLGVDVRLIQEHLYVSMLDGSIWIYSGKSHNSTYVFINDEAAFSVTLEGLHIMHYVGAWQ